MAKITIEVILNFSIEMNGKGIVSAKQREINELFTKKIVLNFSIIAEESIQSGNLKLFMFNFAPIL